MQLLMACLMLQAVTRNELYGYLHPSTREWKEGLMSVTYRDMSNNKTNKHQWIVLDGDIDAEWIESMNTVMDDNKMLTLASNERIPLTASMRLLLEINHMNHCSPATVSRGGVIYVNADDVGWKPVGLAALSVSCLCFTCVHIQDDPWHVPPCPVDQAPIHGGHLWTECVETTLPVVSASTHGGRLWTECVE